MASGMIVLIICRVKYVGKVAFYEFHETKSYFFWQQHIAELRIHLFSYSNLTYKTRHTTYNILQ